MAYSRVKTSFLWSGASSKTVNSSTPVVSDAITLNDGDLLVDVTVRADNQGTPASGDVANNAIAVGDGTNFDTTEHVLTFGYLFTLDTYGTNDPGEDPAQLTLPARCKAGQQIKLVTTCPQAASRSIVLTGWVTTLRWS